MRRRRADRFIFTVEFMDQKTISAIASAIVALVGIVGGLLRHETATETRQQSDISAGVVAFVDAEPSARDQEIADLRAKVDRLERQR